MSKSIESLEKLKVLAIKKRTEHKNSTDAGSCEIQDSIDSFTYDINKICEQFSTTDAFYKIAEMTKDEHRWHKERIDWSDDEIESSIVELSIEIDNI